MVEGEKTDLPHLCAYACHAFPNATISSLSSLIIHLFPLTFMSLYSFFQMPC